LVRLPGSAPPTSSRTLRVSSKLLAGIQYPSDVTTGLELGRRVAALVIERAKSDGSDAVFKGQIPTGPGYWKGTDPTARDRRGW